MVSDESRARLPEGLPHRLAFAAAREHKLRLGATLDYGYDAFVYAYARHVSLCDELVLYRSARAFGWLQATRCGRASSS